MDARARAVPEDQPELARETYWYLRRLMVLLPGFLLLVTAAVALHHGRLEPSISAYYGGPIRDVFVGVLIATAACMVAYQGASLVEDYTLNGAGFYAVFVALVPSNLAKILADLRKNSSPDGVGATDYIWVLRIALTAIVVLAGVLVPVVVRRGEGLSELWAAGGRWTRTFVVLTSGTLAAFLVLAMVQLWLPAAQDVTMAGIWRFRIHDLAAILLICALAVAVASHAWPRLVAGAAARAADVAAAPPYRWIFGLMVAGLPGAIVLHLVAPDHTVILLEWWEIGLFSVFWLLETRRVSRRL